MKIILLIFICLLYTNLCFSQDSFAKAVLALEKAFYFKQVSESHEVLNNPKPEFIRRFKKCDEHKSLENLAALNFETIINVKYADFIKKGNFRITLQEWEFNIEDSAIKFTQTLDLLGRKRV